MMSRALILSCSLFFTLTTFIVTLSDTFEIVRFIILLFNEFSHFIFKIPSTIIVQLFDYIILSLRNRFEYDKITINNSLYYTNKKHLLKHCLLNYLYRFIYMHERGFLYASIIGKNELRAEVRASIYCKL